MNLDALEIYLREIRHFPLLSFEEEKKLFNDFKLNNNTEAKDKIIKSNLRLAVSIAKRYQNNGLTLLDLIQEANLGLLIAVNKFEIEKGYRFSTYASWWIKQTLSRALDNKSRTIRIPAYLVENYNKLKTAEQNLTIKLERFPSAAELAVEMGITPEKVKYIQDSFKDISSLDTPMGEDDEDSIGDLIADTDILTPEQNIDIRARSEMLEAVLATLETREKEVIQYRYGLVDEEPKTLEEIGRIYGVTKERIRQIEAKALRKLRNPLRAKMLKEAFDF